MKDSDLIPKFILDEILEEFLLEEAIEESRQKLNEYFERTQKEIEKSGGIYIKKRGQNE